MTTIGVPAIAYALPATCAGLEELDHAGKLDSGAARLRSFGFERAFTSTQPAHLLALTAARRLLDDHALAAESIDALFYAGAIPSSHAIAGDPDNFLDAFNYPASQLQYELGLLNATVCGISQSGCVGLMNAVSLAANHLRANPNTTRALCVSADVFPPHFKREIIYNLISDGACALLVEKAATANRILAFESITKGYYWDCVNRSNEIIAAYFPTAKNIVRRVLDHAGLTPSDIDWIIPHNVSLRSWEILLGLLDFPRAKPFADNIAVKGHVIAADNWINLKDATDCGKVRRGDKLLLFNFGFGANWSCMLLEH